MNMLTGLIYNKDSANKLYYYQILQNTDDNYDSLPVSRLHEDDIKVEENLNLSVQIPKMMLHTFVENAFKHGLRQYEKDGLITIDVAQREPFSSKKRFLQ